MKDASVRLVFRAAVFAGVLIGSAAGLSARQSPAFPTVPADLPVGQGITQPCLSALPGEVLCGRFRVWENRAAESGRTIDVAFVVLKALNDRGHTDAYTQFNGGPGAPITGSAAGMGRALADIRAERDLLLIDHRGTGASGALACTNPYPGGIASRFRTVLPLDHAVACRDMLQQRTDLSQYTTANAMDDLADVAGWLGYSQLNLSGGSYGTREVQVFARRHPDMVRTAIMNGVAPVNEPVYVHHARYLQDALENLFEDCEADTACRTAYPELRTVLDAVLEKAKSDPPLVEAEGDSLRFGIGALSYALRGLLYGQSGTVPARIHEASAGQWQPLADYYIGRQAWVGASDGTSGYHFSVLCAEDIDPLTWAQIAQESAGTFMGDALIAAYKRVCEQWPSAKLPAEHFEPVHSEKPALILSGGRDPVTPPSGAESVAAFWPNSIHIVVPNGGHGQGGPCIDAMVLQLIATGSIAGIDTNCVSSPPPTRFEIRNR